MTGPKMPDSFIGVAVKPRLPTRGGSSGDLFTQFSPSQICVLLNRSPGEPVRVGGAATRLLCVERTSTSSSLAPACTASVTSQR